MRREGSSPPPAHDSRDPSFFVWLVATISLVLPFAGIPLVLWGIVRLTDGEPYGWPLLIGGSFLIALDVWIDFVWAKTPAAASDDPTLNDTAARVVGRMAIVAQPIEAGRGKVRIGDTLWIAEGPDLPEGAVVRITGARGTVLRVSGE